MIAGRATAAGLAGARAAALAVFLLTAGGLPASQAASAAAPPAVFNRDEERCRTHADLDACDDAIRRSPRNPALLVAQGDALKHANRPAEALRAYHRAAALAPNYRGLAAKIAAAEKKPPVRTLAATSKRFTNADPVAQSH